MDKLKKSKEAMGDNESNNKANDHTIVKQQTKNNDIIKNVGNQCDESYSDYSRFFSSSNPLNLASNSLSDIDEDEDTTNSLLNRPRQLGISYNYAIPKPVGSDDKSKRSCLELMTDNTLILTADDDKKKKDTQSNLMVSDVLNKELQKNQHNNPSKIIKLKQIPILNKTNQNLNFNYKPTSTMTRSTESKNLSLNLEKCPTTYKFSGGNHVAEEYDRRNNFYPQPGPSRMSDYEFVGIQNQPQKTATSEVSQTNNETKNDNKFIRVVDINKLLIQPSSQSSSSSFKGSIDKQKFISSLYLSKNNASNCDNNSKKRKIIPISSTNRMKNDKRQLSIIPYIKTQKLNMEEPCINEKISTEKNQINYISVSSLKNAVTIDKSKKSSTPCRASSSSSSLTPRRASSSSTPCRASSSSSTPCRALSSSSSSSTPCRASSSSSSSTPCRASSSSSSSTPCRASSSSTPCRASSSSTPCRASSSSSSSTPCRASSSSTPCRASSSSTPCRASSSSTPCRASSSSTPCRASSSSSSLTPCRASSSSSSLTPRRASSSSTPCRASSSSSSSSTPCRASSSSSSSTPCRASSSSTPCRASSSSTPCRASSSSSSSTPCRASSSSTPCRASSSSSSTPCRASSSSSTATSKNQKNNICCNKCTNDYICEECRNVPSPTKTIIRNKTSDVDAFNEIKKNLKDKIEEIDVELTLKNF